MSDERDDLPEFEFDEAKSRSNKLKHGIDFVEEQDLWLDDDLYEVPARSVQEERFLVIVRIGHRHWSAVFGFRGRRVRLISVRRSRFEEVVIYESQRI
jgi:uncharacterized DUF497 family protein